MKTTVLTASGLLTAEEGFGLGMAAGMSIAALLVVCVVLALYIYKLKSSHREALESKETQIKKLQQVVDSIEKERKAREALSKPVISEEEILKSMEVALLKGEFQFYLQPQVDQFTKEIQGAEALVRWIHPEKGVLNPGDFMPTLEKCGFITKLDRYIFEQVCIFQHNRRVKRKKTVPVSVNLSRVDLNDETLFEFLQEIMKKYQIPPTLIHLEIAASVFSNDVERLSAVVSKLRDAEFYVGIDNVGKDQISREVLKDVPSDGLKLDIHAIRGQDDESGQGKQEASSVLRMGHMSDRNILVGSVETEEQASYLKYIGFRNAQGFLYYKPMPTEDFEKLLAPKKKG